MIPHLLHELLADDTSAFSSPAPTPVSTPHVSVPCTPRRPRSRKASSSLLVGPRPRVSGSSWNLRRRSSWIDGQTVTGLLNLPWQRSDNASTVVTTLGPEPSSHGRSACPLGHGFSRPERSQPVRTGREDRPFTFLRDLRQPPAARCACQRSDDRVGDRRRKLWLPRDALLTHCCSLLATPNQLSLG